MSGLVMVSCGLLGALVFYLLLVLGVAHLFTTPRRVRPCMPPADVAAQYDRVQFPARNEPLQLAAWYRQASQAAGAVILVHGRDGCRGDELRGTTVSLVSDLVSRGLSVLLLDLRGHGESGHARLTFGQRERHDILGAVDFLLARGYLPTRIGVLGASMGGAGALAAAVEEPAIGALVTDSTFATLDDVLHAQFTRLTHLPSFFLAGALVAARLLTGVHLLHDPPAHNMMRLRGLPTLVIHAEQDPFVPVQHAHALFAAGAASVWITPGKRHLASFGVAGARYLDVVGTFFGTHLVRQPV